MDFDKLMDIRREITSNDGSFEELEYWTDLDELLDGISPREIVKKMTYGDANYLDEYFKLDIYGNLVGCTYYELKEQYKENEKEILKYAIEYNVAKKEAIEYIKNNNLTNEFKQFNLER